MSRSKAPELKDYVIVGGSTAGATAAQSLRTFAPESSIVLICAEDVAPYHRPPLSKFRSSSDKGITLQEVMPRSRYTELGIDLRLGTVATGLNRQKHVVTVHGAQGNEPIQYRKLLIATGASPTPLEIPGHQLAGVHCLRTYQEACSILADAHTSRSAVVIGGGVLGIEIASSLCQLGLSVTVIERDTLLYKLHHPDISAHFEAMLRQHGVDCRIGQSPLSISGNDRAEAVVMSTGEKIACDMVVMATGVAPNTKWLADSGVELGDGIVVNEFLQTNDPDIYAAGDVALAWHPVFRQHIRPEHWDNAIRQAKAAARNMVGDAEPYSHISYFFSHVFDQSYNALGLTEAQYRRLDRGSLQRPPYESLYLDQGICQGFFTLGRASENARAAETLIRDRVNLTRYLSSIAQPGFALRDIPGQTLFILQGGGAYGAFECGAIRALQENNILPDLVAGVSIGAFNGAIIAAHREHAAEALESFWHDISVIAPDMADEASRRMMASSQVMALGVPGFFSPRWMQSMLFQGPMPSEWTSFYDFSPAKALLEKYVDFPGLRNSPVRLLVTAVDVQTGEVVVFDSYVDTLTSDHILASGSLPPAFDWTTIDGRHYWDAGIISNSPLEAVLQRVGSSGKQIYLIDLFTGRRQHLPGNMMDVNARREEIIFSERLRRDHNKQDVLMSHRKLIEQIMGQLPEDKASIIRSEPLYQQLMGQTAPTHITRIMRETAPDNPPSKAYDFSRATIVQLINDGYLTANEVLRESAGQNPIRKAAATSQSARIHKPTSSR